MRVVGFSGTQIVELTNAVSLINNFPALAGLDLTVRKGEIVGIEGPNGAGKSTLLRLCAGLAPLRSGSGQVLGYDIADRDDRRKLRRESGLLAHETYLYGELTVLQNIRFWAKANRADPSAIDPVLDRLGIHSRLRSVKVRNLSAGQRRRASFAVMVCRRPHIWLLDEPHAALDSSGKDVVDSLIRQAVRFGATVLFVSHDHERSQSIATRMVKIGGGRLVSEPPTSPRKLLESAKSALSGEETEKIGGSPQLLESAKSALSGEETEKVKGSPQLLESEKSALFGEETETIKGSPPMPPKQVAPFKKRKRKIRKQKAKQQVEETSTGSVVNSGTEAVPENDNLFRPSKKPASIEDLLIKKEPADDPTVNPEKGKEQS